MKIAFKLILLLFMTVVLSVPLLGDGNSVKGLLILEDHSGMGARNVLFSDLTWADFDRGTVTDINGFKTIFPDKDIGKIVYFDSQYYAQLDADPKLKAFRGGLEEREIIANTNFATIFTSDDLSKVQASESALESILSGNRSIGPMVQPQFDLLKDDVARYSNNQRMIAGEWMSKNAADAAMTPTTVGTKNIPVTFTTKDGKKYVNVLVSVTDTGVNVLTSDGGLNVAFNQLSDDLTVFPDNMRRVIHEKSQALNSGLDPSSTASQVSSDGSNTGAKASIQRASSIAPAYTSVTVFESSLISNFTADKVQQLQVPRFLKNENLFTPSFGDDLPPTISMDGKNAIETIQFINKKICGTNHIIYYDKQLKTFVLGQIWFTSNKRLILSRYGLCFFNPADFNPDKIVKFTDSYSSTMLKLYTTDNKESINGVGISGDIVHGHLLGVLLEDGEDAQSVANAWAHLFLLYGGKSDEF